LKGPKKGKKKGKPPPPPPPRFVIQVGIAAIERGKRYSYYLFQ
jgi:hypothetical protein